MFAIPTGSRLSELSNIISTKAEMTRGPVPSYSDREREIFFTQRSFGIYQRGFSQS